jgi:hypothetical protein
MDSHTHHVWENSQGTRKIRIVANYKNSDQRPRSLNQQRSDERPAVLLATGDERRGSFEEHEALIIEQLQL